MSEELFTFPGYRVGLRPISVSDVDDIMEWVNDPTVTRNFAGMSQKITREQELRFIESTIASKTDRLWAIIDQDGVNLGNAGIHKIYWPARNGRLGIVIGRSSAQGRGLGQEALKLLIAKGFMELGLHKLWVVHYSTNARMRHILKKLSFSQEGVLRDEYFHADAFHDMVRQSLLEDEFSALKPAWHMS
jgi:RimJ/RimL family protein N-acetyltransferase